MPNPTDDMHLVDEINRIGKQRANHQMDEPDYVNQVIQAVRQHDQKLCPGNPTDDAALRERVFDEQLHNDDNYWCPYLNSKVRKDCDCGAWKNTDAIMQLIKTHTDQAVLAARINEVREYAPMNVAKYFAISMKDLNHSWYLDFCHDREADLKRQQS